MAISYNEWMKVRTKAKEQELVERQRDTEFARPPLQVAVTDMVIREMLERIAQLTEKLNGLAGDKATSPFGRK